jgi:hypothetical protein
MSTSTFKSHEISNVLELLSSLRQPPAAIAMTETPKSPESRELFGERLVTFKKFLEGREWPSAATLRYYIFMNKFGFADQCVRRLGRKIFIDVVAFDQWILQQAR